MKPRMSIAPFVALSAFCSFAFAAWEAIGPCGGFMGVLNTIPSNANLVYCLHPSQPSRIFKTTDGGGSWSLAGRIPHPNASNAALAVAPSNPEIIYVGADTFWYHDTIYRTTDGGVTWTPHDVSDGWSFDRILRVHPTLSGTVFAAGYHMLASADSHNIAFFKSTDAGENWTTLELSAKRSYAYSLCLDPSNPDIIYLGGCFNTSIFTTRGIIFKSNDGGGSFTDISSGFDTCRSNITALAVHPTNSDYVYAGTDSGVYRSTDGGDSWSSVPSGNRMIFDLATTPANPNVVYASRAGPDSCIIKSTDAGTSWFNVDDGAYITDASLAVKTDDAAVVWAGTGRGIMKTVNGGTQWFESNNGLNTLVIGSLGIAPSERSIVYTSAAYYSEYKSYNCGDDWIRFASMSSTDHGSFGAYGIHNHNPDIAFAITSFC